MTEKLATERFMRDVKDHTISILRDDGIYRHIRFRRPDTITMGFDLVTWPGVLCYTGDMGTYVFSRLPDMFEFFRVDWENAKDSHLPINPGYWSEKLLAVDSGIQNGSALKFSKDKFVEIITGQVSDWIEDHDLSDKDAEYLRSTVKEEVLKSIDMIDPDDWRHALRLASNFTCKVNKEDFYFDGLWDYNYGDFADSLIWCCHAIVWGIDQYDAEKAKPGEAVA